MFGVGLPRRRGASDVGAAAPAEALQPLHGPAWRGMDEGRAVRADEKASELLRSVVGDQSFAMYAELGFLHLAGRSGSGGYAYLIYPHRPVIAYDTASGELLSEYCVGFPDDPDDSEFGTRLPDADDVLAKWMALSGDEKRLLEGANLHAPGRQLDPAHVHRDLERMRAWKRQHADQLASGAVDV